MSTYIDIHALQTLPPSNINRDDTGAPKTATFGGVPRQRVSSQAWKKSIRDDFEKNLDRDKLGVRTRRVVERIADTILEIDENWNREDAEKSVEALLKKAKIAVAVPKVKDGEEPGAPLTGYLMFLSTRQIRRVAEAIIADPELKYGKKELTELLDTEHSFDIAMFGRMIAEVPDYNVDAAVQVAHAIGVAASEPEFDFFTAVDDVAKDSEESGAGMLGTVQMMSSTLYRYATINVDALKNNLGADDAAVEASVAFVRAFISSLPTGKLNTFANQTLPYAVVVTVRSDRPISWVNAFEAPVQVDGVEGCRIRAARKLAQEATAIDEMYDTAPVASWVISLPEVAEELNSLGDKVNRTELLDGLRATVETTFTQGE